MSDISALKQKIANLADHCVKCGLCSAQCPTYLLKQDENESPRGRIALAQALASDAMQAGDKITTHLNNCLQCRQCEASCPSQVKYGDLINATNELLNQENKKNSQLQTKLISKISGLSHKNWLKIAAVFQVLSRIGLIQLFRLNKMGKQALNYIPNHAFLKKKINHTNQTEKTVFLFTGCLSHIFDKATLQTCAAILQHCGYTVNIPAKQTCCGAIATRQGLSDVEQQCQLNNQLVFSDKLNQPIIFFTTGCGAKLKEYEERLPTEVKFANRAFDITYFLENSELFAKTKFSSCNRKVLIFNPCSERNILKQTSIVEKLLSRIPDIELISLPKSTGCCGASGSHFITHQDQANQIRSPILEQIISLSPDIIVSPNYPCNMHIQAGLKEKNIDIAMIHPIELLYKQMILE